MIDRIRYFCPAKDQQQPYLSNLLIMTQFKLFLFVNNERVLQTHAIHILLLYKDFTVTILYTMYTIRHYRRYWIYVKMTTFTYQNLKIIFRTRSMTICLQYLLSIENVIVVYRNLKILCFWIVIFTWNVLYNFVFN